MLRSACVIINYLGEQYLMWLFLQNMFIWTLNLLTVDVSIFIVRNSEFVYKKVSMKNKQTQFFFLIFVDTSQVGMSACLDGDLYTTKSNSFLYLGYMIMNLKRFMLPILQDLYSVHWCVSECILGLCKCVWLCICVCAYVCVSVLWCYIVSLLWIHSFI
jgi:hypothetical protein